MKKLLLLTLTLLLSTLASWATESTIALGSSSNLKANGTFYNANDEVVNGSAWCPKLVVGSITFTGCLSSYSGYVDATKASNTLTISVPAGKTISSYSLGLRLTGNTTACTVTGGTAVTLSNSMFKTVAASGVNAQSTNITFSSITQDNASECLLEISDLTLTIEGYEGTTYVVSTDFPREINIANGTFYNNLNTAITPSASVMDANKWVSTAKNPELTLISTNATGSGGNSMPINNVEGFRIHTNTYKISVSPDRYRIKGYFITAYARYTGGNSTITPNGQTARLISQDSSNPTTIYVDGLKTTETTFSVSTANPWIQIVSFRVAIEDLIEVSNDALDELAGISVYSSSAAAAKTAIASCTTLSEIESVVNEAVDINVAFGNCNTADPVKYLATTGENITGSNFSTDAAWKLTGYNAETGTFKIYNATHETYVGPLPTATDTPATATTDASAAGVYTITVTGAGAAGGAGKAVFHQPNLGTYRECIHYQSARSIAVRWGAAAKASQWEVTNVYSLTYNHHKVADAKNPVTEGATLFATSTNYYLSGTNIEYTAPLDGLSPIGALNVTPSNGAITSDVVVDYYYEQDATLPFTTSTISGGELDNPTWYYIQTNGLATYASGNKMVVDGSSTGLHYERWCFVGDAINGVQIYAESKGAAYPLNIASMANNDNVQLTSTSTNTRWFVTGSTLSDLLFYQKSGNNYFYLSQLGGVAYGSGWSWKVGLWSSGSTVSLSAAASNMPDNWAIESINYIPTETAWTNAGTIGWPSTAAKGTLQTAMRAFELATTYANYSALLTARNNYINASGTNLTTPPAGFYKFYHKNTSTSNNKYVYADGTTAKSSTTNGTTSQKIWYFDGSNSHLVNYDKGYQFSSYATLNTTGIGMTISGHTTHTDFPMPYNIKPSDANGWYVTNDDNDYNLNRATVTEGSNFYVEKVTSLPITISAAGYATLYAPVALTIPSGVKAYYVSALTSTEATLTEISTTIPANTGVILYANVDAATTYNFNITTGGTDVSSSNKLSGVIATTAFDDNVAYTLQQQYGGTAVGLFPKAAGNLAGFKAYMLASQLSAGVKGLVFSFEDADGISQIENGELQIENAIYNIAGQRVTKPTKGLYIKNGKKVIIK